MITETPRETREAQNLRIGDFYGAAEACRDARGHKPGAVRQIRGGFVTPAKIGFGGEAIT